MLQQLITEMKNLIFSSEEEGFTEDDTQQLKQVTPDTMISLLKHTLYTVCRINICCGSV